MKITYTHNKSEDNNQQLIDLDCFPISYVMNLMKISQDIFFRAEIYYFFPVKDWIVNILDFEDPIVFYASTQLL